MGGAGDWSVIGARLCVRGGAESRQPLTGGRRRGGGAGRDTEGRAGAGREATRGAGPVDGTRSQRSDRTRARGGGARAG